MRRVMQLQEHQDNRAAIWLSIESRLLELDFFYWRNI